MAVQHNLSPVVCGMHIVSAMFIIIYNLEYLGYRYHSVLNSSIFYISMLCLYHVCSDVVISSFPLVNSAEVDEHCVMSEWLRLVMTCGTADKDNEHIKAPVCAGLRA